MLTLLLLANAEARPRAENTFLLPVTPTGETRSTHAAFFPRPKRASSTAPWVSDYPPVECANQGDSVALSMTPDPAAWPYSLPDHVTCTQGAVKLTVRLGFQRPRPGVWVAADGTIVIPVPQGADEVWLEEGVRLPGVDLVSAEVLPASEGLRCEVRGPGLKIELRGGDSTGPANCHITTTDGKGLDRAIVVVPYSD